MWRLGHIDGRSATFFGAIVNECDNFDICNCCCNFLSFSRHNPYTSTEQNYFRPVQNAFAVFPRKSIDIHSQIDIIFCDSYNSIVGVVQDIV